MAPGPVPAEKTAPAPKKRPVDLEKILAMAYRVLGPLRNVGNRLAENGTGVNPAKDAVLMICPFLCLVITGKTACTP